MLVRPKFEAATSGPADRRSADWANQVAVSLKEPLRKIVKMERRPDKCFCWGCGILREKECLWKKPSLNKTDSHKTRRKILRICDIKSRSISFTSHLLRWACGSFSSLKSSKTNRRFKRTKFAQEIRKGPKMKKKTISVTVTYLLIKKTDSSESRSELSSMAELTRVQAECQRYMKSLFNTEGEI